MSPKKPPKNEKEEVLEDASIIGLGTPLFHNTLSALIERERGRCWVTGKTAAQSGEPVEAHHHPVERCFADRWDWARFAKDCQAGAWGGPAQAFDWVAFFVGAEMATDEKTGLPYLKVADPYLFADNMLVNGRLLSAKYHTGKQQGIHCLPEPLYLAQKYLTTGYHHSMAEVKNHE